MHVVVLAYGPSQITKRAVARARKIAGKTDKTIAVAASPAGTPSLRHVADIETMEAVGRAGLRQAFDRLPDEPALLIHDDVVLTKRGAAALSKELGNGARYVVPYSNDQGVDHYLKPLPSQKAAERSLDQIDVPHRSQPATAVRPGCLAATTHHLELLLTEPIADPYAVLDGSRHGFVVAGGALASHATKCVTRLVPKDPTGPPLLVAALIVRDEHAMLPGCLQSLTGVVDRIEICDTGSTDDTVAIAEAAGARVTHRKWPDDFAAARNYVLEQCRDARYVLQIDADERVECADPAQLRRYLATYWAEHAALSIAISNVEANGAEMNRFNNVRIFHAQDTEFRGAVHEAVYKIDEVGPLAGAQFAQLSITHHGYAREVVAERNKTERNLALAETEYENNPGPRAAVHLARSLRYAGESPQRALALLEETWAGSGDAEPAARTQILGLMADLHAEMGNNERAFELSHHALELVPADDTAAAMLATTARRLGRCEELIAIAESLDTTNSPQPAQRVAGNRAIFNAALAQAYASGGQSEKAVSVAFDVLASTPEQFDGWEALVGCLRHDYGDSAIEILASLAAKDPKGGFLEPMVGVFPSAALAEFGVLYHQIGGTIPEVTRVGLLAAAMSGFDEAFAALVPAGNGLDPLVRVGLADRIASNGRSDLADMLRQQPVVLHL